MNRYLVLLTVSFLIFGFQNCADVAFETSLGSGAQEAINEDGLGEGNGLPDDDRVADGDEDKAPHVGFSNTCSAEAEALAQDLQGSSYYFNNNSDLINIKNADQVYINGNIDSVAVHGARQVFLNGNTHSVCLRAQYLEKLNGDMGELVVIGQVPAGERAPVDEINGNSSDRIVLTNVNVQKLNGNFNELHLINSSIAELGGNGVLIQLAAGSTIAEIDGSIGSIVEK